MHPQTSPSQSTPESYQNVLQVAERLYKTEPDWVSFFREILGIEGVVRRTFPTFDELTTFERSEEYDQIQKMVVRLRERKPAADTETEPTRVITVRLPKSMHEFLRTEAHDLRTSMNKLCISKLLQFIEQDQIPAEKSGPPKRRTTPAPAPAASQQPLGQQPMGQQPVSQPGTFQPTQQPTLAGHSNGQPPYKGGF